MVSKNWSIFFYENQWSVFLFFLIIDRTRLHFAVTKQNSTFVFILIFLWIWKKGACCYWIKCLNMQFGWTSEHISHLMTCIFMLNDFGWIFTAHDRSCHRLADSFFSVCVFCKLFLLDSYWCCSSICFVVAWIAHFHDRVSISTGACFRQHQLHHYE